MTKAFAFLALLLINIAALAAEDEATLKANDVLRKIREAQEEAAASLPRRSLRKSSG